MIYDKLHEGSGTGSGSNLKLTAGQFLGKEPNVMGYTTPASFLVYAKSLRPQEVEQLEQAFNHFKDGSRIIGSLVTRTDRSKRVYQHPAFLKGNSQPGCKIILESGMKEFLTDYMAGNVAISFTLEELIEEALN
jgi:hypothetical protein